MKLHQDNINPFLNKYIEFVDQLCFDYGYDCNIRHLLYLIVPAFVVKYDSSYESLILKTFLDVRIYIGKQSDDFVMASFNRELKQDSKGYCTNKYIVLNQYENASLTDLLDNIVHEFNHAVNSMNNEISFDDQFVQLRTGLSYLIYERKTLNFLKKSEEVFLEEIINTEQTEEIINIINSFGNYHIDNVEFYHMLFALQNEISGSSYTSKAYYFQSFICDTLMKNRTFISTISSLRFKGLIDDVSFLFDNVIGKEGSYRRLNFLLKKLYDWEMKYTKSTFFKKVIFRKLKTIANEIIAIVNDYDNKCIYKT